MSADLNVTCPTRPYAVAMSNFTITRTGTVIAFDPDSGLSASGLIADEAISELRRLIAERQAA